MSRKAQRLPVGMTVTLVVAGETSSIATVTTNISTAGMLVKISATLSIGTQVQVSLLDDETGSLIDMEGVIARQVAIAEGGFATGIHFADPGIVWSEQCKRRGAMSSSTLTRIARRYRILVVGDEARIRAALALYVTSGFDVRFAGTLEQAREALSDIHLDAVIAERELGDAGWAGILESALARQPAARRLVRSSKSAVAFSDAEVARLVHRVVDTEGGVDALIDAITAKQL